MRVLIIEDDKRLARLIQKVLEEDHLIVDVAHNGGIGLEIALRGAHDVAIVDWMLPDRDGPSICRAIRTASIPMALLMLTARTQIEDRVAGLYSGADDYLCKPFSFDELIARLHALARRSFTSSQDASELRVGSIVLDLRAHTARRGTTALNLTKTEWALLEYLMRHPGLTLSREKILDYVWSYESSVKPSLVDVYISYLRQKLTVPGMKDPIITERGIGYRFHAQDA